MASMMMSNISVVPRVPATLMSKLPCSNALISIQLRNPRSAKVPLVA